MDTRHNQLILLSKRVNETNDKLTAMLKALGWTREELKQQRKQALLKRQCPFHKQHLVTEKNFKQHYKRCLLKSRNVDTLQQTKPLESSFFFYKNAKNVISFVRENGNHDADKTVLSRFPKQDYFVEELAPISTTAEKRAEYDAMIAYKRMHTTDNNNSNNNKMGFIMTKAVEDNNNSKKKRVEEPRDKRRPKQYRGKMKTMTPTEIQRELINGYMQELSIKK